MTKEKAVFDCGPVPTTHWFVRLAVPGRFADWFDLDALAGDYAACLQGEQLADDERALAELRGLEVAEVAADPRLSAPATAGEYARTGLTLGYHPATTAGLVLHGHSEEQVAPPAKAWAPRRPCGGSTRCRSR